MPGWIHAIFAILMFTVFSTGEVASAKLKSTAFLNRRIAPQGLAKPILPTRAVLQAGSIPSALRMAAAGQTGLPGMTGLGQTPMGIPSAAGSQVSPATSDLTGGASSSANRSTPSAISQPVSPSYSPRRMPRDGRTQTDLASLPPPRLEQINPDTRGAFGSLRDLANQHMSGCGSSRVANRGAVANIRGYFYGVTNSFARSICRSAQDPVRVSMGGTKAKMIWNYARLTALGMYESSGGRDIGVDVTNGSSNTADTAEAGIWQTSNNVRRGLNSFARAALERMEREYERNPNACMQNVYAEGLGRYRDGGVIGGGAGARFQILQKRCPALAAETTAITALNVPRHYGPILRGEAQAIPRCEHLFRDVAELVERNPTMCTALAVVPSNQTPAPVQVAEARK